MTEDEMAGWYHQLSGCESEQDLGDGEGQGSLVCCSPQGRKELDMMERLNNKTQKRLKLMMGGAYFAQHGQGKPLT